MKRNRFDPLLLLFVLVALIVGFFLISPPKNDSEQEKSSFPTTYSTSRKGMKGLYLVLEKLEKDVRQWKRPLTLLEKEEIGTLVVAGPRKSLSPREKEALDVWFSRGGQMVLLHDKEWEIKATGYGEEADSFNKAFDEELNLYVFEDRSMVNNIGLKENPDESLQIIQQILAHEGPIYFDEYHHYNGETLSPWLLLKRYFSHPIGWATLHLTALLFLYLLSAPNLGNIEEKNRKKINLIQARALFLELSQAKEFADQVVSKYRRNKK